MNWVKGLRRPVLVLNRPTFDLLCSLPIISWPFFFDRVVLRTFFIRLAACLSLRDQASLCIIQRDGKANVKPDCASKKSNPLESQWRKNIYRSLSLPGGASSRAAKRRLKLALSLSLLLSFNHSFLQRFPQRFTELCAHVWALAGWQVVTDNKF